MHIEIAKVTINREDRECIPLQQVEWRQWNQILRHSIQSKAQKENTKEKKERDK